MCSGRVAYSGAMANPGDSFRNFGVGFWSHRDSFWNCQPVRPDFNSGPKDAQPGALDAHQVALESDASGSDLLTINW
jgi:hypothetical protein